MANETARESWATRSSSWVRDARLLDQAFAPFTAAVLDAADLETATAVLDVGCGTGTLLDEVTTRTAGSATTALGVDISLSMVEAARERVPDARVVRADAQTANLRQLSGGRTFDRVVSRFGVMFFEDPVAAFANLRAATTPGARLAFACWRADEDDLFLHGLRALSARLDPRPGPPATDRPGAKGLATRDHITAVLTGAGWSEVAIDPVDGVCDFCLDGGDGVEERLAMVLDGSVGQVVRHELEPLLGAAGWRGALEEARAELRSGLVDGGVRLTGRTWLVTAAHR